MRFHIILALLLSLCLNTLFAKSRSLDVSKQTELRILKSLDIRPTLLDDKQYNKMKHNINELSVKYFLRSLNRGQIFLKNLHEIIGNSDIPNIFLYMAMTESKFTLDAKSNKNARGLWQLMPRTARHLNLKVNANIDERLDPIKSTQAAIKYLEQLHERFGKWYLVAIAYNCGETKLAKAIKKARTDDLLTLLNPSRRYLPLETRIYIRRIIVAALLAFDKNIILKNSAQHLFGNCNAEKLIKVPIKAGVSIGKISKKFDISSKEIRKYNPHILNYYIPKVDNEYYIYLPEPVAKKVKKKQQSK